MIQNNTVKNHNDREKASDSIINSPEFNLYARNKINLRSNMITKTQEIETESFNTFLDKRNRKSD